MTPTPPNPRAVEALAAALMERLVAPENVDRLAAILAGRPATPATVEGALLDAEQAGALLNVPKSWILSEAAPAAARM
jgi:hypothetical protein